MLRAWFLAAALAVAPGAHGQGGPAPGEPAIVFRLPIGAASDAQPQRRWLPVARRQSHLSARDLGLVVNDADPYSVAVGAYYARARHLETAQVLHVRLPAVSALTPAQFADFERTLREYFGPRIQALALAWVRPYAVGCNSITGAIALGDDQKFCANTCGASTLSPLFNEASPTPYALTGARMSMLLAAPSIDEAQAMIDRGVASDRSLGWRGAPLVHAHFVTTQDTARSVRSELFPPGDPPGFDGVAVDLDDTNALHDVDDVLIYMTGVATVHDLGSVHFVPGALADHLTSFGGSFDNLHGQMSALAWIAAGATASYGTVSEPCSYTQKFPHPQILLLSYLQGATAIEAYWASVAWPRQGVFIGEPLAAPFAR
jgi:uncharacterized protein (TIGR03790 family)